MAESRTHWKQLVNCDYLGAYSLKDGEDMILTIKSVANEVVIGSKGKRENLMVARFMEDQKPMILNRTNAATITKLYKTPYVEAWAGKKIQIFQSETKFGGEIVECLRIRPFIPSVKGDVVNCSDCTEEIKAQSGKTAQQIAESTMTRYGRALCADCARAEADRLKREAAEKDALKETAQPEAGKPESEGTPHPS